VKELQSQEFGMVAKSLWPLALDIASYYASSPVRVKKLQCALKPDLEQVKQSLSDQDFINVLNLTSIVKEKMSKKLEKIGYSLCPEAQCALFDVTFLVIGKAKLNCGLRQ